MQCTDSQKLHAYSRPVEGIALPEKFTYPFHYTPHPLCTIAAEEVQAYLQKQTMWEEELKQGKMFGVLVVQTDNGRIGYLASFSGILAGKNNHPYFVPPVYDLLRPDDFFKKEEACISDINERILKLEKSEEYQRVRARLATETAEMEKQLKMLKEEMEVHKKARDERRKQHPDDEELEALSRQSQYRKAEFKRTRRRLEDNIRPLQNLINKTEQTLNEWKAERKSRSAALQLKLFKQFRMLNGKGESLDLCSIFQQTVQQVPPAGAGECAAPKLLQYAYLNHLKPVAMAEFWWGDSPKTEIRRHGYYYPACKSKCEPILKHMLQGLDVEENPLLKDPCRDRDLEILYEDEWLLIVNKPAGMLSVPGKISTDSVYDRLKALYPDSTGPMIVHRLDMATSGLLLVAKTKEVHKDLQAQFKHRTVKKRYTALLDSHMNTDNGIIDLPICANPDDRPRQMVDARHGKPAITRYEVIEHQENRTLISLYPLTGRTHQLRVHAAHHLGLNAPIVGDELYGKRAERLYLHAEYLEFTHPVTKRNMKIEKKACFH